MEHPTPSGGPSPPCTPDPAWFRGPPLPVDPLGGVGLSEQLRELARRHPDRLALVDPRAGGWTYRQIDDHAGAVGGLLTGHGVAQGSAVAVLGGRSAAAVGALLGVLRAGCAYVPVDADLPPARRAQMLTQAGVVAVLDARGGDAAQHGAGSPDVPVLPALRLGAHGRVARIAPGRWEDPRGAAYVVFTSGSTGAPRGVAVSHLALSASCRAHAATYRHRFGDRLLASYAFGFDGFTGVTFWALLNGHTLVVAPDGVERDAVALAALVHRYGVTHVHLLPSVYDAVLPLLAARGAGALRSVSVGAEVCPPALASRHLAGLPAVTLTNDYGPTEAAVWTVNAEVTAPVGDAVPVGRPYPGCSAWVLREDGSLTDVGEPGELWLAGEQLALGYVGEPTATAQRFVELDAPDGGRRRALRTGDVAAWRPDGQLEFLGRRDDQVKVRGNRVELADVEAALLRVPGVEQALAAVRDGRLVAAVVAGPSRPTGSEVAAALTGDVPSYLVPEVVVVDALPRTPNGKRNRSALSRRPPDAPDPDGARSGADRPAGATSTDAAPAGSGHRAVDVVAEVVRRRVEEVLGSSLPLAADPLATGLTSLDMLRITGAVSADLDVDVEVVALLDAASLGEFVSAVQQLHRAARG